MHQRWKARQTRQGKHPQYEDGEYNGEETGREDDGLEMMVERWRRRMEKTGSAMNEKELKVPEEEVTHEAHSRVYREGEGKKGRPQRNSRKKNVGSKNGTRQKSHHARCASDDPQDPNIDSPCAHHCSQGKRTQPTEQSVWCVLVGQEGHSTNIQTYEELSSQEIDQ